MRTTRLLLATAALAGSFAVPALAAESEPPVGICSYDIDWGYVPEVLRALPAGAGTVVAGAICRI
jgi:hypothetical protein